MRAGGLSVIFALYNLKRAYKVVIMSNGYTLYLRVSTKSQGRSGLGLEAQRQMAAAMAAAEGSNIVAEFVEVESGKNNARPVLREALAHAKKHGTWLLVAKLDRLARSVGFVARLLEAGTPFRAADCPHADKTMLQMLSVMAEWERDQIAKRTKQALAAAKARGVRLGNPNPASLAKHRQAWNASQVAEADKRAKQVSHLVARLHCEGYTLGDIAQHLTEAGYKTARGGAWTPTHIHRIIKRTEAA